MNLKFLILRNIESCSMKCFSHASLGNFPTGKSMEGSIILISGKYGKCSPLNWKSITNVRNSLSTETCAMDVTLDTSYFLMWSLREILCGLFKKKHSNNKIDAYTESKSLYRHVHSTTMLDEHQMRIDIAQIRQMINNHELNQFLWVPAPEQFADGLTKWGSDSLLLTNVLEIFKFFIKILWQ